MSIIPHLHVVKTLEILIFETCFEFFEFHILYLINYDYYFECGQYIFII
jgi:hypothetical protein